jgi:hypothetical protein
MVDDYIEPPANTGSGNKVDVDSVARGDGSTVKRQRMVIPDLIDLETLLGQILVEMKVNNLLITLAFDLEGTVDDLRNQSQDGVM